MNYDEFRTLWHEALDTAGLLPSPLWPSEAVDLRWMSRTYSLYVSLDHGHRARPFHTTAHLGWRWDAALAARTATTEEDLLIELLGQDGYYLVTERPWLRVDVTLRATLPMDSPLPMPDADAWRHWTAEVDSQVAPFLPIESREEKDGLAALSWRNRPGAQLDCDADGELYLTRVELSAWQGIDLPRQWDNPDRMRDTGTKAQLTDFTARLRQALREWESCLMHLHSQAAD